MTEGNYYSELVKIFQQLKKYNMRFNPEKYAFRIRGGKFLSFMLINRGIEANLKSAKPYKTYIAPKM